MNYTEFLQNFGTEPKCLEYIFRRKYDLSECPRCQGPFKKYKISRKNKAFYCPTCLYNIYPCSSSNVLCEAKVPLTYYMYILFLISHSRVSISAYHIYRSLNVNGKPTYKTCASMLKKIYKELGKDTEGLNFQTDGWAEIDEQYIGGKPKNGKRGRNNIDKMPVFTIVSRDKKKVRSIVLPNTQRETIMPYIKTYISPSAYLSSDENNIYDTLNSDHDYIHHITVKHKAKKGKYVNHRTGASTNNAEGFHNITKSIFRTHKTINREYLQLYLNYAMFLYNHSESESMFLDMLDLIINKNGRQNTTKEKQEEEVSNNKNQETGTSGFHEEVA